MNLKDYQNWVTTFYKERNWYAYDPFIRCAFLTEEVGELAQAVRKKEIGRDRPDEMVKNDHENLEDIKEEIGDILDNIFILADKYDLPIEDVLNSHILKLEKRFNK